MTYTDWFSANIKPYRQGVYERQGIAARYSYWNGKYWGLGQHSPGNASKIRNWSSASQYLPWRGIAK